MSARTGKVTVTTENIFPIIRKWLYSDHDIFVRELVSNASDATTKLKRLVDLGQCSIDSDSELSIRISYNEKTGVLIIEDQGIGMTSDELDRYINQIAFSGAMDFVEKYKEKGGSDNSIIGHFGLGFYSAFMVADRVTIDTLSYVEGEKPVKWESEDGMEYTVSESDRTQRGTSITLTLSDEAKKMFDATKIKNILDKYCSFMPYPLFFTDVKRKLEHEKDQKKRAKEAESKKEEFLISEYTPLRVNPVAPLWQKAPKDCTDEEYISFYHQVFSDPRDPLFWIHLNLDYPFTLQGILYFPKTDNVYQTLEGRIKVYNQQVFVADNIEEIIPDFLFLLRGCLDCTDLPLNVSRSALQQDDYVQKLSSHIIRKVSDKLSSLFKKQREDYESYWDDIGVFVKYGMMKEDKFFDKAKAFMLFKTVEAQYLTYDELTEKHDAVRYTQAADKQAAYIDIATKKGYPVVVLDHEIDNNFISFMEFKLPSKRFMRVDAEFEGESHSEESYKRLTDHFKSVVQDSKLDIEVISLGVDSFPAFIRETEESRRMSEMKKQFEKMKKSGESDPYGNLDEMFPEKKDLVLNADHPLVARLMSYVEADSTDDSADIIINQLYDQARLSHGSLDAEGLKNFLQNHSTLLLNIIENRAGSVGGKE
ncbi:MAG: molecular chaperone HtpG [Clostridiaceae bacterium]|nr:molecular chaperone HtpG [Clostridiaceae bacterium]